jgi:hypothetical protein
MKNPKTIFTATVLVLAFALAPGADAWPRADGGPTYQVSPALTNAISEASSADATSPEDVQMPVITIHNAGDITRGKTGSFVLNMKPALGFGGVFVNFSVSGTAISGVDYVPLVSPAYIGPSGYGVILVQSLPDPRASAFRRAYSVIVTLEAGAGYALGKPTSAQMTIKP